jgi:hypothetical protein
MKKKLTKGKNVRRRMMFDIVETQIQENEPPETKQTLNRLLEEGYSREEAMELIAIVVASEIYDVMKHQQPFNRNRFVERLEDLPELPED